jgi:hypothetical protein
MLVLCLLLAGGPILFVEQPLPGVQLGPPTPFTAVPTTNYLQTDLDGDQDSDLILPDAVYLQERGVFPEDRRIGWPGNAVSGEADAHGPALFIRTTNHLYVYTVAEGAWHEVINQPLDWPGVRGPAPRLTGEKRRVQFRRFTFDVDGDNTPELIDLDSRGIHLFRRVQNQYEAAGLLQLLPPMTVRPSSTQAIWPESERQIVLPEQEMSCRLLVSENALTLVTLSSTRDSREYRREVIRLDRGETGEFRAGERAVAKTGPVPAHVRPCYLNQDGALDLAGTRWSLSETTPVTMPMEETWASLDGGTTFHIERVPSFQQARALCSFVDFDSDGDMDLITESTGLYAGGVREAVVRYLTATIFSHSIQIRKQEDGAFHAGAPAELAVDIDLGSPPASGGAMLDRYISGQIVNLTGDFNADGYRDAVVRTRSNQLVIYLAEGWSGFFDDAAAELHISDDSGFGVADLNGDGYSDILFSREKPVESGPTDPPVAYFGKVGAP